MVKYKSFAGAGKAVISIPKEIFPVENFNGVHDEVHARVLLIENNVRIVIVSLEVTSLKAKDLEKLKSMVAEIMQISLDNIWICVTHTFNVPHIRSEDSLKTEEELRKNGLLYEAIEKAVKEAALTAFFKRKEVRVGFGLGHCPVNVNRDMYTPKGWWLGSNEEGFSDKSVPVIRFEGMDGSLIALLYSYDVQSSVMDGSIMEDGGKLVTGDLAGAASRYIEKEYGEKAVALFIVGAAGNQAPAFKAKSIKVTKDGNIEEVDVKEDGFVLVEALGNRLGGQVVDTAEKIQCIMAGGEFFIHQFSVICPGQEIPKHIHDIHPTRQYTYVKAEERETSVEVIQFNDIILIGVQPEISSFTASQIKKASPFSKTLIFTMVNGGAKYMAEEEGYERITYESMNSAFGRGAAEILKDRILGYLKELKEK